MIEIIFLFFLFLIIYTYFLYPLILLALRIFFNKPINKKDITPSVSLIITAHNEEKNIREKIENSLNLDYPKDELEIIVASDCSTDNTDKIIKEYEVRGVKLVRQQIRRGKTAAQNRATEHARGEILVFSDAPTMYRANAIKKLVRNYNDRKIGFVTGEVIYTNETDSGVGEGGSLYWKYESWIKQMESDIGSVIGAAGCIYSMRQSLYTPFDEEYISDFVSPLKLIIESKSVDDDFITPFRIYTKGIRSIMEPEAVSMEKTSKSQAEEFRMRCRVITRAISGLLHMVKILDPFKFPKYSFQLFSHKILRWFVPVSMIIVFLSNLLLLENKFYYKTFQLQLLFYILAFFGYVIDKAKLPNVKVFFIPYYFCVVNLAVLTGISKYVIGRRDKLWTPAR
jgi:cellulose synthase/poly-beta-1,6-N-acetylglucosamine synthase-like glycosyltransferase